MHVSEQFQKVLGATIASVLVIAATFFILLCIEPSGRVAAQNAGNTGTFTAAQLVFTSKASNGSSAILQNIGQSSHMLTYCTTGFGGHDRLGSELHRKFALDADRVRHVRAKFHHRHRLSCPAGGRLLSEHPLDHQQFYGGFCQRMVLVKQWTDRVCGGGAGK